jgi:translation initiation factor 4A
MSAEPTPGGERSHARIVPSFDDDHLGLPDTILRGIYAHGFEHPSDVQQKTLLPLREGRDVIAQARSGTGKTGSFAIAACAMIASSRSPERGDPPCVVILQHTRELCRQTARIVSELGQYANIRVALAVGGENTRATIRAGADVVVGTPHKVVNMSSGANASLLLAHVAMLVIDECDAILKEDVCNGFLEAMTTLLGRVPPEAQIALYSATLPAQLLHATSTFMRSPVKILMDATSLPLEGISQSYIRVQAAARPSVLTHVMGTVCSGQTMIFCQTRSAVAEVTEVLSHWGIPSASIEGGMSAADRQEQMRLFQTGSVRVMVSTSVLARGIDVQQVNLVILYDMVTDVDTYLHCVGRCGRYGRQGTAVLLLTDYDMPALRTIEQHYDIVLQERSVCAHDA